MCGRVAHDAAKFLRNVLWCKIQNQEPGYQLDVTRACVHVRVNRVDHVQEIVLRDPVRRSVGHELARKHEGALGRACPQRDLKKTTD